MTVLWKIGFHAHDNSVLLFVVFTLKKKKKKKDEKKEANYSFDISTASLFTLGSKCVKL